MIRGLIEATTDLELHAALRSSSSLSDMLGADVAIDVTHPGATGPIVEFAVDNRLPIVVGTSGWSQKKITAIEQRARAVDDARAVLFIPNFSLGSTISTMLAATAARWFDAIEIIEAHHAGKVDSPSGTAVRTAEQMAQARSAMGPVAAPHTDQRARGDLIAGIPVHSLRLPGVLARQEVIFGGAGETLSITHTTQSPGSYEAGILLALRTAAAARGVSVGLESLLDIDSIGLAQSRGDADGSIDPGSARA